MKSILTLLIFSMMLMLNTDAVQAQARSGLGINAGLNTSEYGMGYGGMFTKKICICKYRLLSSFSLKQDYVGEEPM